MSNHGAMNTFPKPLVGQSRAISAQGNHESNHAAITRITPRLKPQVEQSRTNEHRNHAQAITNPTVSLETGVRVPPPRRSTE